jgi:GNAT superfamily N-acetyltransferase
MHSLESAPGEVPNGHASNHPIAGLAEVGDPNGVWRQIEAIFFESAAVRSFSSAKARAEFLRRWTEYYRRHAPEDVIVAMDTADRVAGYVMGCRDSRAARPLFRDIPNYGLFADLFADFPAHFHINCRPDVRGRGVGGRLAERFVSLCEAAGLPGVHVVTAEGARNVAFYRARGFDRAVERTAGEKTLLFLGRRL